MTYRDDLAALSARHTALEAEVAHKTRELDQAGRLLAEATAKSRLPVLDNLRVASPCSAQWSKMTGDERSRHCGDCSKSVYNLSGMTRDEAEALIIEKEGRLCVRYFQRTDGTILLKDCAVGAKRRRRRRLVIAGAAAMLAGSAAIAYAKTRPEDIESLRATVVIEEERVEIQIMPIPPAPEHTEELQEVLGGVSEDMSEVRSDLK